MREGKLRIAFVLLSSAGTMGVAAPTAVWRAIAWNNLGMHCMDADFSVFSILPPYNTIHAQVVDPSGRLVTNPAGVDRDLRGGRRSGRLDQHDLDRQDELLAARPGALRRRACRSTSGSPETPCPGAGNLPQADDLRRRAQRRSSPKASRSRRTTTRTERTRTR